MSRDEAQGDMESYRSQFLHDDTRSAAKLFAAELESAKGKDDIFEAHGHVVVSYLSGLAQCRVQCADDRVRREKAEERVKDACEDALFESRDLCESAEVLIVEMLDVPPGVVASIIEELSVNHVDALASDNLHTIRNAVLAVADAFHVHFGREADHVRSMRENDLDGGESLSSVSIDGGGDMGAQSEAPPAAGAGRGDDEPDPRELERLARALVGAPPLEDEREKRPSAASTVGGESVHDKAESKDGASLQPGAVQMADDYRSAASAGGLRRPQVDASQQHRHEGP